MFIPCYSYRWSNEGTDGIVTCSSLKKCYRETLAFGVTPAGQSGNNTTAGLDKPPVVKETHSSDSSVQSKPPMVLFVYIKGSEEVLKPRMEARQGHFMPPQLLQSQLATLEEPGPGEHCVTVDVTSSTEEIVTQVEDHLNRIHMDAYNSSKHEPTAGSNL